MSNFFSDAIHGLFGGNQSLPPQQNPADIAAAQDQWNQTGIKENNYNTVNDFGGSTWTTDSNGNRVLVTASNPAQTQLINNQTDLHNTAGTIANTIAPDLHANPALPDPNKLTQPVNTNPNDAYSIFRQTGVLPGVPGSNAYGPPPVTQPGTDAPGDTGGGSGMQSPTGTQSVTGPDGQPVYGTTYGNSNNAAYLEAMGVKPAVAAQDLYAWQASHPNGEPMPRGWTIEGSMSSGQGVGGGASGQYKAGTLGQTVGAAPTLGQVGTAEQMQRMNAAIPQGQTVSQAEALARLQAPTPIANYTGNTPVAGYSGGKDIAGYGGGAPQMEKTKAPGAQQQFTGTAPTPEMIANGGSVAGAGEGIMKNLDLSNLGDMPTASEATLKQVQDALYARQTGYLDPQYQAEQAQLNARLANQGIGVGARANTLSQAAEASAREKAYAGARNDAILMGGAEQSRLFNMQMAARQQGYTEDLGQGAFQNAAQGQGYAQQLANQQNVIQGTTANNAANNAQLAAQMAIMNQNNQASQTDFQNQFNITGQNNAAQQALGQYNLGAGQLNAQIGNWNQQNALGAGQLNANIGIANNAANLGAGQLNAQIAQNNFGNNLATAGFNNAAIQGDITNQLATTGFNNQVGQQGFANQLAQGTFNNQAAQQDYANQLAGQGFNNTALNQGYQNTLAGTGFNNQVQQQDIANTFTQQQQNTSAAVAAAQMAQAKASSASAAGQLAASVAARNQAYQLAQQQRQDQLNQNAFTNYMQTLGVQNGATQTDNANALSYYQANLSGNNSDFNNFNGLVDRSGAIGPPSNGGNASYTTSPVNYAGIAQGSQTNNINSAQDSYNQNMGLIKGIGALLPFLG